MAFPQNTIPENQDTWEITLKKILLALDNQGSGGGSVTIAGPLGPKAQSAAVATTPSIVGPASLDKSVTATVSTIYNANANGAIVSVSNNGLTPVWIDFGGVAPVADTATPTGIGRGIMLAPGGLWESPVPITTAVQAIAQSGQTCSVRVTA